MKRTEYTNKRKILGSQVSIPLDDEADDVNEADFEDGLVSTDSKFLDPRYNLLDVVTPIASQHRLSYLIECYRRMSKRCI